jgi:UDP-N-acetylmuramoyl-tripeptide--D-alanyl-D-alanine ligase
MSWQTSELTRWCGGTLTGADDVRIGGVSTDTRSVQRGQLFVAISGEHFDGHDYLEQAVAGGAAAVLVSRSGTPELSVPSIRVDDTVRALGALASAQRMLFEGPVIAITGSNGKTTTKEMCADMLGAAGVRVRRTPGNLNNHIGLPLSVLALEPADEVLVVELGMNHPGEIDTLARIAQPDVGAITQVAPAHLGLLGSLDAIARAKGELLDHVRPGGTAVLNADDARVMAQRGRFAGTALTFGFSADAEFRAVPDPTDPRGFELRTPVGNTRIELVLPGPHWMLDGACAAAAAHASGRLGEAPLEAVRIALEQFRGAPGRLRLIEAPGDVLVLDDSYNANPHSAAAALETLSQLRSDHRALAVLADMLELGDDAAALHAETGSAAAAAGVDVLIAVGPLSAHTAQAAREKGVNPVVHVDDADAAIRELAATVRAGDLILVKGSRGMAMERAVRALVEEL